MVLAVAPEAAGPAADLIAGCYCSDVPDLVAGMQPVRTSASIVWVQDQAGRGWRGAIQPAVLMARRTARSPYHDLSDRPTRAGLSCRFLFTHLNLATGRYFTQVCLALPPESERGGRGGKLINALGVTLQPYLTGSSSARVALAALDTAAAAVVSQLQQLAGSKE